MSWSHVRRLYRRLLPIRYEHGTSTDQAKLLTKVVVTGSEKVGKTAFLRRIRDDSFDENYLATIGVDFFIFHFKHQDTAIRLNIWDTAGQEKFKTIIISYFRGANAIILMFDLTQKATFDDLEKRIEAVKELVLDKCIFAVIGTKSDLDSPRIIEENLINEFCTKYNIEIYREVSSKTGQGVTEAISAVTDALNMKYGKTTQH